MRVLGTKANQKNKHPNGRNTMSTTTRTAALALTGVLALGGAAACGSGSSGGSTPAAGSTAAASSGPVKVASIPNLTGASTQVQLAGSFLDAAKSLKVALGVTGNATASKTGDLSFPITGGDATYYKPGTRNPYVTSHIEHQGSGITLTAGKTVVGLSNFVVNAGTSQLSGKVTVNGKTAIKSTNLFFLNGRTLQPLSKNAKGEAVLAGTKVFIDSAAASVLDKTFKLKPGTLSGSTLVGVATITLK
jgi:hypothetical protein